MVKYIFAVVVGFGFSANVIASNFEGTITELSFSTGESPARVSIRVGAHGSECTAFGGEYYAYENADTGLQKIWTSAVLAAYTAQKTVLIGGTGTCDPFGIEKIRHINVR